MRIAGVERAGYYPTPPLSLAALAAAIGAKTGDSVALLDPCAGEGEALHAVAETLRSDGVHVATYGAELSPERAAIAKTRIDHLIAGDWFDVACANSFFSLLWLNPPYDWQAGVRSDKAQRLEYIFLKETLHRLRSGGWLVYIVPQHILQLAAVARMVSHHFEQVSVLRFPDPEYERFQQVVLLGRKRKLMADEAVEQQILAAGEARTKLPILGTSSLMLALPPAAKLQRVIFERMSLTEAEAMAVCAQEGVLHSTALADRFQMRGDLEFTPATPLRRGHLAMLLASGLMGTTQLPGGLVAKGRAVKKMVLVDEKPEEKVYREQFSTQVFTLDRFGGHKVLSSVPDLEGFLTQHGAALAQLITDRFQPLYQGPEFSEWQKLAALVPDKRLPGRQEAGLLDAQKHVALAAYCSLQEHGHAHIVAEMGWGKSMVALATLSLIDRWPALVLCPPTLTPKWKREVESLYPEARAVILSSITDLERLRDSYQPGERLVAILSREKAKLGSGWQHAVYFRHYRSLNAKGLPEIRQAPACPSCGEMLVDKNELPITHLGTKQHTCPQCGAPLYAYQGKDGKAALHRWPLARYIRNQMRNFFQVLVADEVHEYKGNDTDQGQAFQHLINATRLQLTLTGTFFGGKSCSIFWLLYRLSHGVRRQFGFRDDDRWSALYGRLEEVFKLSESKANGAYSGQPRWYSRVKEIPGISPQVVEHVLPTAIFTRLEDLGYRLPDYREEIHYLDMNQYQAIQYKDLDDTLQAQFKAFAPGALKWISIWFANCLARPNSGFRDEQVMVKNLAGEYEPFLDLPKVIEPDDGELLPKEQWLIETIKTEKQANRKVLVYIHHTGTRDIQPRIRELLSAAGLRAEILPPSLDTTQREGWILANADRLDALLVNPKKVGVGLDLVMFATCVFFEVEFSLVRRVTA